MATASWPYNPERLSEEQAATIPLALCTAGDALYNRMIPRLPLPWEGPSKKPILIWGASSQVGVHAVQFARESGCTPIIATASPKVETLEHGVLTGEASRLYQIPGRRFSL